MSKLEGVVRQMGHSRNEVVVRSNQTYARRLAVTCVGVLLAILLSWTTACLDSSGPRQISGDRLPGLAISAPVPGVAGAASVQGSVASASTNASVVYVSLTPGTVPTGLQATIRDVATSQSVTTGVVNGGFDPVVIPASDGDTLAVDIERSSDSPLHVLNVVRLARPPVVVRTDPPPKKVDVPLNAVILVVFSTPIDPTTLNAGSIQLWRNTTRVSGTVRFSDAAHIRAEFHPNSLLAGLTDYRLVITQAIRDVNGAALVLPLDVSFTTGTTLQVAQRLAFTVLPTTVGAGLAMAPSLRVAALDGHGNVVTMFAESISVAISGNPVGGALLGTTTAVAVAGVATFRDVRFDRASAGYTLIATAPGLSTGASAAITILPLALTGRIAFVSDRNGGEHIYRANPDGSGVTQLTSGSEPDMGPTWSPDGTRIAFGRWGRIYVMQADGSGLVPLADSGFGMEPAWSTDGTRIAYQGPSGIFIVQADGSGITPVTDTTAGVLYDAYPAWSPDGRQIAFQRVITLPDSDYFTQVYVVNADGSGLHRLTETTSPIGIGYASGGPAWSPDGTAIAFWMAGHGLATITMPGDGTGAPTTVYADCCFGRPTWSPDGAMLAFNNYDYVAGTRQIWLVRSDGVVLGSLTGSLNGWDVAWSR